MNLNERAAIAMGWRKESLLNLEDRLTEYWVNDDGLVCQVAFYDPEHDRNSCHELLMEVKRRGLLDGFAQALFLNDTCPSLDLSTDELIDKTILDLISFVATAPTELLTLAAIEALESVNKEPHNNG